MKSTFLTISFALAAAVLPAQQTRIEVNAGQVLGLVSRNLTGVCIEDVNHEIYGGLYSQMIFGESFQEPVPPPPLKGFMVEGRWAVRDSGQSIFDQSPFPSIVSRLVRQSGAFQDGSAGVEIRFDDAKPGNAGLILRASGTEAGLNTFTGYEVWLDPAGRLLRLVAHRPSPETVKDARIDVPLKQWIRLEAKLDGPALEILIDGKSMLRYETQADGFPAGMVGVRAARVEAAFRNLWVETAGRRDAIAFQPGPAPQAVSAMWRAVGAGSARGSYAIVTEKPFLGTQSQRVSLESGQGQWGVENQGLNRWGMSYVKGRPYEGYVWVRSERPATLFVALESRDGVHVYAERGLAVAAGKWRRLEFSLTPGASDPAGRFALKLKQPGSVVLGYAFLQAGEWGRFKGLPVRRDVAEGMVDLGMTVIRYGGSMVNNDGYRWKNMIGPRGRRPPYSGMWYGYSSNGWGIPDFMAFAEAAGFEYIPAFNMDETPQDMADFIEYAKGPADSAWGRRRAADGHPAPYKIRYLELGNEERVDDAYFAKFKAIAEAVWAKDRNIVLVVGDFHYSQPIQDPFHFTGAASHIITLAAHRQILELAARHGREVWFDVHVDTNKLPLDGSLAGMFSFTDALEKIGGGAKFKVAVFELNAANHSQKRALANALAIQAIERDGRVPVVTSANGLQPDGQNDNAWDQGLVFLNPSRVWLQPPGYVARMLSRNYLPQRVRVEAGGAAGKVDAIAKRSQDGRTLTLQVLNPGAEAVTAEVRVTGFTPRRQQAEVTELSGAPEAANTAADTTAIAPKQSSWKPEWKDGRTHRTFPPHSFTIVRFE